MIRSGALGLHGSRQREDGTLPVCGGLHYNKVRSHGRSRSPSLSIYRAERGGRSEKSFSGTPFLEEWMEAKREIERKRERERERDEESGGGNFQASSAII